MRQFCQISKLIHAKKTNRHVSISVSHREVSCIILYDTVLVPALVYVYVTPMTQIHLAKR